MFGYWQNQQNDMKYLLQKLLKKVYALLTHNQIKNISIFTAQL